MRKGFESGPVEGVLESLAGDGLLSDRRFAEAYVASRAARGFGPLRIREELRQRGIAGETRDLACPQGARRWDAQAAAARSKRFGPQLPQAFPDRARQARFLSQRGFSRAQVAAALGGDAEADPE